MPTSPAGTTEAWTIGPGPVRRARGFSLVEILVVLVIAGIAVAGVSLSVRGSGER